MAPWAVPFAVVSARSDRCAFFSASPVIPFTTVPSIEHWSSGFTVAGGASPGFVEAPEVRGALAGVGGVWALTEAHAKNAMTTYRMNGLLPFSDFRRTQPPDCWRQTCRNILEQPC